MLKTFHQCDQGGSILDDFEYFDKEEMKRTEDKANGIVRPPREVHGEEDDDDDDGEADEGR